MNFKAFIAAVEENLSKLGFDYDIQDDKVTVNGTVTTKTYDDGIYIDASLYESGNLCVTFVFDEVEPSLEVYRLINEFNDNVGYLKAYITTRNEKNFLAIDYYVLNNESEEVAQQEFEYALMKVVNDSVSKYLLPITAYTHE